MKKFLMLVVVMLCATGAWAQSPYGALNAVQAVISGAELIQGDAEYIGQALEGFQSFNPDNPGECFAAYDALYYVGYTIYAEGPALQQLSESAAQASQAIGEAMTGELFNENPELYFELALADAQMRAAVGAAGDAIQGAYQVYEETWHYVQQVCG